MTTLPHERLSIDKNINIINHPSNNNSTRFTTTTTRMISVSPLAAKQWNVEHHENNKMNSFNESEEDDKQGNTIIPPELMRQPHMSDLIQLGGNITRQAITSIASQANYNDFITHVKTWKLQKINLFWVHSVDDLTKIMDIIIESLRKAHANHVMMKYYAHRLYKSTLKCQVFIRNALIHRRNKRRTSLQKWSLAQIKARANIERVIKTRLRRMSSSNSSSSSYSSSSSSSIVASLNGTNNLNSLSLNTCAPSSPSRAALSSRMSTTTSTNTNNNSTSVSNTSVSLNNTLIEYMWGVLLDCYVSEEDMQRTLSLYYKIQSHEYLKSYRSYRDSALCKAQSLPLRALRTRALDTALLQFPRMVYCVNESPSVIILCAYHQYRMDCEWIKYKAQLNKELYAPIHNNKHQHQHKHKQHHCKNNKKINSSSSSSLVLSSEEPETLHHHDVFMNNNNNNDCNNLNNDADTDCNKREKINNWIEESYHHNNNSNDNDSDEVDESDEHHVLLPDSPLNYSSLSSMNTISYHLPEPPNLEHLIAPVSYYHALLMLNCKEDFNVLLVLRVLHSNEHHSENDLNRVASVIGIGGLTAPSQEQVQRAIALSRPWRKRLKNFDSSLNNSVTGSSNNNNVLSKTYNVCNLQNEPIIRTFREHEIDNKNNFNNNNFASTVLIGDTQLFSPRHRDALGNPLSWNQNSFNDTANNNNKEKRKTSSVNLWNRNIHSAQPNMINTAIIPKEDGTFVLSPRTSQTRPMTGNVQFNKIKEHNKWMPRRISAQPRPTSPVQSIMVEHKLPSSTQLVTHNKISSNNNNFNVNKRQQQQQQEKKCNHESKENIVELENVNEEKNMSETSSKEFTQYHVKLPVYSITSTTHTPTTIKGNNMNDFSVNNDSLTGISNSNVSNNNDTKNNINVSSLSSTNKSNRVLVKPPPLSRSLRSPTLSFINSSNNFATKVIKEEESMWTESEQESEMEQTPQHNEHAIRSRSPSVHSKAKNESHSCLRRSVQLSPAMLDRNNRFTSISTCETNYSNVSTPKITNGSNNINNSMRVSSAVQRRPSARASMAGALLQMSNTPSHLSSPHASSSRFIPPQRDKYGVSSLISPLSSISASSSRKVSSLSMERVSM